MVKKVVAIETCNALDITEGKVYEVIKEGQSFYIIIDDRKEYTEVWKMRFKPLEEEREIKVGSEWLWEEVNETLVVKCVGDTSIFYQWKSDLSEGCEEIDDFLKSFKPKPTRRTVWLNVYEDEVTRHYTKNSADWMAADALLYQQEVELIDPREGERNE